MTDEITLEELLETGVKHAHRILLEERHKSLSHFFHFVLRDGRHAMMPIAWNGELEKKIALAQARSAAKELDAVMMMGLSEAWALSPPDGVVHTREEGRAWMNRVGPPSEHPQRREVVMIFATDGDRTVATLLHMKRDKPGGKLVGLERDEMDPTSVEGRIIEVLPRQKRRQNARGEGERP